MPIPETHYARGSDVRIAYQVIGDGPIDLLFLQGGWYPVDLVWEQPAAERFIRRLASFSRVIMFDFRGWGASGADVGSPLPTAETWADDIRLVLDAVGSTQAAVVSSTIAVLSTLYFVAAHPDRVQGLVLVDGWARWHESEDYPDGMPVSVAARTNAGLTEHYGTGVNVRWLAPSVANDDEFVRWWGRCQRLANHPLQISRYWEEYSTRDYRSVLPSLRLPTLVLHHVDNPYIRFSHGSYLAEHIPGATLLPVPGADSIFFVGDIDAVLNPIEEFLTGRLAPPEPGRVLATVLFTDIVGSTEIAARLGDQHWAELLDRHDAVVALELDRHRGRQVKSTGDGMLATFDGPARAVRCAQAIQESVRPLGLEVRAGVHTGEIEHRGDDIGGIAVHIGQRISTLAPAGAVYVSRTVTELVTGSGLVFEARGEHELRGVPGVWQLFALANRSIPPG
jgi:class 3 adenylate cyclase/pimeloyl-ACP methyl ester carboxylesterase